MMEFIASISAKHRVILAIFARVKSMVFGLGFSVEIIFRASAKDVSPRQRTTCKTSSAFFRESSRISHKASTTRFRLIILYYNNNTEKYKIRGYKTRKDQPGSITQEEATVSIQPGERMVPGPTPASLNLQLLGRPVLSR